MRKGLLIACLGLAPCVLTSLAAPVQAAVPETVLAKVEVSTVISGTLDVEADGRVSNAELDNEADYQAGVIALVRNQIAGWEFEPVLRDGQPVAFRTPMQMHLVGTTTGSDDFVVRIDSVNFSRRNDPGDATSVRANVLKPPRFPKEAISAGYTGTVYLLIRVGPDGRVIEVEPEQVNLTRAFSELGMTLARKSLAKAAVNKAKEWTFLVPSEGDDVGMDSWQVRVPVTFSFPEQGNSIWEMYIPGPRTSPTWSQDAGRGQSSAMGSGGVYRVDQHGPRLRDDKG